MNNLIKRIWKQNNMTSIEDLQGSAFTAESGGHTFQISGVDANGDALSLSGTVVASFIRSDGTTVALSGSASGGVVSVTLTAECYGVPGRFGLVIFLTSDSQKTAIYSCVGNVARSSTGNVSPGTTANVVDLINQINAAVATIPASYSALMADIAPTYSDSALYAVGNYAWYNGDLKRCISPITTAESYTAAHWTSAVLGQDVSDLKSAINNKIDNVVQDWSLLEYVDVPDGYNLLTPGVPQGVGAYYASNGAVHFENTGAYANYRYFILPVIAGETYYIGMSTSYALRFSIITDATGNILFEQSTPLSDRITIPANGAYFYGTYQSNYTMGVSKGSRLNVLTHTYKVDTENIDFPKKQNKLIGVVLSGRMLGVNNDGNIDVTDLKEENIISGMRNQYLQNMLNHQNLLIVNPIVKDHYYASAAVYSTSYDFAIVPVVSGVTYAYGRLRFLSKYKEQLDIDIQTLASAYGEYTADFTGDLYVTFQHGNASFFCKKDEYDPNTIIYTNGHALDFDETWLAQSTGMSKRKPMSQKAVTELIQSMPIVESIEGKIYSNSGKTLKGSLTNDQTFRCPGTNVKKNNVYVFTCNVSSFDKLQIGNGDKKHYCNSWIEITNSKLILHNYLASDNTTEYEHGLTISGYVSVMITVAQNGASNAEITIFSNGNQFTQTVVWYGCGYGGYFVYSDGSTLTDCTFTWASGDFRKSVWIFGDSYLSIDNSRWAGYLVAPGYINNVLINAYPGEYSIVSVDALNKAVSNYGVPKILVWCLGMNDGSDSEDTPSNDWMTNLESVKSICDTYNIELVLATIPTVPTINHEVKNAYVKASGYRYIDFAKAVGADSNGNWHSGMLYTDGVHPTTLGAKALYYQAIADVPEITFGNP